MMQFLNRIYHVKILFLTLCAFVSLEGMGQDRFKAGAKVGLTASQVDGDTFSGYNLAGLTFGGFVRSNWTEKWGSQFEINFNQKGSNKNPKPEKGDFQRFLLRVNYVEVPLLIDYSIKKYRFETGLLYGRLLSSKEENEFGPAVSGIPLEQNAIELIAGTAFLLNEHIGFKLRWQRSIVPIRKFDATNYLYFSDKLFRRGMYNNALSFTLDYQF